MDMRKQSLFLIVPLSVFMAQFAMAKVDDGAPKFKDAKVEAPSDEEAGPAAISPVHAVDQAHLEKQVSEFSDKLIIKETAENSSQIDLQDLADMLMGKHPKVTLNLTTNPITGVQLDKERNELLVFTTSSTGRPANFRIKGGYKKLFGATLSKDSTKNIIAELNRSYSDKCIVSPTRSEVTYDTTAKCLKFTDSLTISENIEWIGQDERSISEVKGETNSAMTIKMIPYQAPVLDEKGVAVVDPKTGVAKTEQKFYLNGFGVTVSKNVDAETAKGLNPLIKGAAPTTNITQEILRVGN